MSAAESDSLRTQVALIGMGTVGTEVARILTEKSETMTHRAGRDIRLKRVVVRDATKPRNVELPAGTVADNIQDIIDDNEIDVVVQLIGGIEPAREIMLACLAAGKDVVTANKALICEHGDELFAKAREQGQSIAYEAAVAGGIPIIAVMGQSLTANQIVSIEAILNGTSNFILSEMLAEGRPYEKVLKEAQRLGYAEADPTMDVDGTDAAQKLVILSQLAFGTKVPIADFPREGIDKLDLLDLQYARELGYIVKLLAVAKLVTGQLELHVQPTLVRKEQPLAQVNGPYNMIALTGDELGRAWFAGAGAGGVATASAVVADLIDTVVGRTALTFRRNDLWSERPSLPVQPAEEISRRYYLRFMVDDKPHVLADIADILGRHGISIASVVQHETPETSPDEANGNCVPLVIMTHTTTEGKLRSADEELDALSSVHPPHSRMPVLD